jgi:hypothetical protein
MQAGWEWRRELESRNARARLKFAAASGARRAGTFAACTNDLERLSYLARLGRRADDPAFEELSGLIGRLDGDLKLVAREALAMASEAVRRRAKRQRPKTTAPQPLTRMPRRPSVTKSRPIGLPPTASSANR